MPDRALEHKPMKSLMKLEITEGKVSEGDAQLLTARRLGQLEEFETT
jgi:hypothetical protein